MNTKYYDVIVAGAGPAGICAAVAAARQGARVALIERYGVIGGNLTAGYVGPILGSVSKNTMRDEVCAILGVKDNDWIGEHGNAHDFEEAKLTLAEFVAREKNVDVFLQCCVSDVIRDGKVVKGIKCASNEGTLCFEAAVTIDCTGDAIVSFLAGAKIEKGRADGLMQPVTLEYTIDLCRIYLTATRSDRWMQTHGSKHPGKFALISFLFTPIKKTLAIQLDIVYISNTDNSFRFIYDTSQ